HGQLANALEHGMNLAHGTLSGLHERDGVRSVALGLIEAADLGAQLLADRQAGRVVSRAVDAVAAGELLHRLRERRAGLNELPVRVERLDVALNAKGHDLPP